jgi:Second Messenger Oligonucleotide or Dinucleotide Synthetase domain
MTIHALSANFSYFFGRINPSVSFQRQAASEHQTITALIEGAKGVASELSPKCFLQGSYRQETAIYTINDVDIVVLCGLTHPPVQGSLGGFQSKFWTRDMIFDAIAAPLLNDMRYRNKVKYHNGSMCIKVDLGIKIEILPVVFKTGISDSTIEPFRLYRPEKQTWEDGYARYHQRWLTVKNKSAFGNFIPAIKVLKHMRSLIGLQAVSFHIECLLYRLPDNVFFGSPADYCRFAQIWR